MATRQEEFIADEDLDDLYALLDNAALVIGELPEANFCSSSRSGCGDSVSSEEIIQKKLELSISVQKSVSMICVYI